MTAFDGRFAEFDQHSLQMKVFADPFVVPVEDVSPEYRLELIDMQSSDTMRAAFRDKTLVEFYKCLPATFVNLKDSALVHASMFWKHVSLYTNTNEAQQKQHPESTH